MLIKNNLKDEFFKASKLSAVAKFSKVIQFQFNIKAKSFTAHKSKAVFKFQIAIQKIAGI